MPSSGASASSKACLTNSPDHQRRLHDRLNHPNLRMVRCAWSRVIGPSEALLIPDISIDIFWDESGSLLLCGPETRPRRTARSTNTEVLGLCFESPAVQMIFKIPAREFVDQRVELRDVIGRRTNTLWQKIADQRNALDGQTTLARELLSMTEQENDSERPVARRLRFLLDSATPQSIERIADDLGISSRHLGRLCHRLFGYGPSMLRRLLRVQRLASLARNRPDRSMVQMAIDAGFADQAHMNRECKAVTLNTPREFCDAARTLGQVRFVQDDRWTRP